MHELRPFQKEAITALEKPGNVLCVAPTGSGKSLIYERAAETPGTRMLLVTPLLALARQQKERLARRGIPVQLGAGPISESPPSGQSGTWIVSPESLSAASRQATLARWRPNLLVVDECHCLWEWGEDFRPSFNVLPSLIQTHSIPRSLWLTATLPASARKQLEDALGPGLTSIGGFGLPENLELHARKTPWVDRADALLQWTTRRNEPGIVFASTRESTRRLARLLAATGKPVLPYHAGLGAEERRATEEAIARYTPRSNEAGAVVVATSAFGMGMDHPHLRWAVLWQAPLSLLSLAQAVGRVGRAKDAGASALVLWDRDDFRLLEWAIGNSSRKKSEMLATLEFLSSPECRQSHLHRYFENQNQRAAPCGRCDRCQSLVPQLENPKATDS